MKIDVKKNDLTEDEILDILAKRKTSIRVYDKYNLKLNISKWDYATLEKSNSVKKMFCFCKNSKGTEIKTKMCPHCGAGIYLSPVKIESKEYAAKRKEDAKNYRNSYFDPENTERKSIYSENVFYIAPHPDFSYGVIIKKFKIAFSYAKEELNVTSSFDYVVEIVPGEFCKAAKKTKSGYVDCDMFEALNINTHTMKYTVPMLFEGAENLLSFMDKNADFTKRTAFKEVYYNFEERITPNSFFMLYMYLYSQYPAIELLAKMNYTSLIRKCINRIGTTWCKDSIKDEAEKLSKIFNPHATTGHLSLHIPKYMGDFLNKVDASVVEYMYWGDIYEYDPLSKENFEKIINSDHYQSFRYSLCEMPNLLKYGYKTNKLFNYLVKETLSTKVDDMDRMIRRGINSFDYDDDEFVLYSGLQEDTDEIGIFANNVILLKDYHNMIELMKTKQELYPSNILDIHDKTMNAYKIVKDKVKNERLLEVAKELKKHIPESDDYTIVCPENTNDFVEEGTRQHNCVASYVSDVASNKCAIFFVRRKDDVDENYITAEYRHGNLYQIKEKNNQSVRTPKAIEFAKKFCKNLSKTSTFRSI